MQKIHLVMPMGGGGTRFGNKGFNVPKPLIELQGKPFFYWATQSIVKFVDVEDITFVVLQDHIDRFAIDQKIKEYENGKVTGTIEKVVVSNEAICGAYYVRNKDIFNEATDTYLENCSYKEFFVSGIYNEMVKKGETLKTFRISEHISFGTPAEYDEAISDKRLEMLI